VPEVVETIRCEAYGPGGAALIVDCRTDNRHRTIAQLRQIVSEHGGYIGARGAVSYLFNEVGRLRFAPGTDAARLARIALETGAEDVIAAALERKDSKAALAGKDKGGTGDDSDPGDCMIK